VTTSDLLIRRPGHAAALKPETLTDQAYNRLEEMIVTLKLAPGAVLAEQALSAELGIGRTPIREALQRLASEGLVLVRLLARASATRATPAQRRRFGEIAEGMDAASKDNNDIVFMRLDRELNWLLIEAAHNEYAARAMRLLNGHSRRFWYLHYKEAADLPRCARLVGGWQQL